MAMVMKDATQTRSFVDSEVVRKRLCDLVKVVACSSRLPMMIRRSCGDRWCRWVNKRDDSRLGRTHIVRGPAVCNIGRPRYASQPQQKSK